MIKPIELGMLSESQRSNKDISIQQNWIDLEIERALINSKMTTAKDGNALTTIAERLPPQDIFKKYFNHSHISLDMLI
jgi:hypothetical protein